MPADIDMMVSGFLECAAWADFETYEIPEGAEFSDNARKVAKGVCEKFLTSASESDIAAYRATYDDSRMGNRVYLDSVGHGTGFWDESGLPEGVGGRLSKVCGYREISMFSNDGETVEMEV